MRIQHNVTAMNSYRNFSANNSQLSKNLEKLSSGYKVNRAGDDAAGLAISEKMRAQITGLEGATKNAKDGISLIQTAEGALTEVHSMLNRMTSLAEQSANGTYDNDVDRAQLQKEIESLKTEIDRVADSTNYNGLKLLDGSLSKDGATKSELTDIDVSKMGVEITANAEDLSAVKGVYTASAITDFATAGTLNSGDKLSMTLNYTDTDGNAQSKAVTLRVTDDKKNFVLDDGTEDGVDLKLTDLATAGQATAEEIGKAFAAALNKDNGLKEQLNITVEGSGAAAQLKFQARIGGDEGASVQGFTLSKTASGSTTPTNYSTKVDQTAGTPLNANKAYDLAKANSWDGKDSTLEDAVFEVNGEKFLFIDSAVTIDDAMKTKLNEIGVGNNYIKTAATGAHPAAGDVYGTDKMADKIAAATGLKVEAGTVSNGAFTAGSSTKIRFTIPEALSKKVGNGGLTLQIGDTADDYNKMTVSINDMHTKSLGIDKIDISTQEGAAEAMAKIKSAINSVSDTRGGLGALQNRLDHTINNLGVMRENIQSAESLIRDTDVAEEMMNYTKNNILNQSAQAMLAQANQLPQGVLQLLG